MGERPTPDAPHPGKRRPPPGTLVPPAQRAKPARKSARCGVGDGSPRPHPHPPHRQPVGSWPRLQAPRPDIWVWGSAQPQAPHTQARGPPPGRAGAAATASKASSQKQACPQGGARPPARQGEEGAGPSPTELNRRSTGPRQETRRGTNRLERPYWRPAAEPRVLHAPPGGGGRRVRRGSTSAHTRNGHATRTRRSTGPSLRNAQTAWNGVPAIKGKGHPGGTTRNTHREGREGGEEPKGRSKNRHRPQPSRPAASAAHTPTGHCTCQGSSSTQCYAPAPRLGSLRASPWGSHWRQASSTGPAAPAARATTHQGGGVVGKRLQPRLLSDTLTGEWQNGAAGKEQGFEPREPGGLRHQAGGLS